MLCWLVIPTIQCIMFSIIFLPLPPVIYDINYHLPTHAFHTRYLSLSLFKTRLYLIASHRRSSPILTRDYYTCLISRALSIDKIIINASIQHSSLSAVTARSQIRAHGISSRPKPISYDARRIKSSNKSNITFHSCLRVHP